MNRKVLFSIASVAAAVEAMVLVTATARGAGASLPAAAIFPYTGSNQSYTVPVGVCGVRIQVEGAAGGGSGGNGGSGGTGSAEIAVQPNDVLTVVIGGRGTFPAGGFGGGGGGGDTATHRRWWRRSGLCLQWDIRARRRWSSGQSGECRRPSH